MHVRRYCNAVIVFGGGGSAKGRGAKWQSTAGRLVPQHYQVLIDPRGPWWGGGGKINLDLAIIKVGQLSHWEFGPRTRSESRTLAFLYFRKPFKVFRNCTHWPIFASNYGRPLKGHSVLTSPLISCGLQWLCLCADLKSGWVCLGDTDLKVCEGDAAFRREPRSFWRSRDLCLHWQS